MDHFLVAQAADPFDPTPMLILADWLEEHGDLAGWLGRPRPRSNAKVLD